MCGICINKFDFEKPPPRAYTRGAGGFIIKITRAHCTRMIFVCDPLKNLNVWKEVFLVFALFRKKYCRTQEGAVSAVDSSGQCARADTDLSEEQKRVEVLRLYSKLFEEGALTEEEYECVKKRLLKL